MCGLDSCGGMGYPRRQGDNLRLHGRAYRHLPHWQHLAAGGGGGSEAHEEALAQPEAEAAVGALPLFARRLFLPLLRDALADLNCDQPVQVWLRAELRPNAKQAMPCGELLMYCPPQGDVDRFKGPPMPAPKCEVHRAHETISAHRSTGPD